MMERIPVFYREEVVATSRFFAPGTFKPGACVADWIEREMAIDVLSHVPAAREQLCLAHDPAYVAGVLNCTIRNGFGGLQPDVAASLPYTTGAMLAAAQAAIENGAVACAPVSGFHHARHAESAGYCTFNGLMVAVLHLVNTGLARRVGILDLDQHYGDGTDEIIQKLRVEGVRHFTAGQRPTWPEHAEPFLRELPGLVETFADCQVLLYQAGADPHIDDPLGGWMTTEQLQRRDRIVFEVAASIGLPVAWNLAGGYQRDAAGTIEPVLEVHRNTMLACTGVHVRQRREDIDDC
jgi:acetoin utilization deacetylase AcuC-like enzyme